MLNIITIFLGGISIALNIFCNHRNIELYNRSLFKTTRRISYKKLRESLGIAKKPEDIAYIKTTKKIYSLSLITFTFFILAILITIKIGWGI